ncbi:coiled-coil domain-containing protein 65-like [Orussus abietinus]|uniref:coiled-coil domain-containing protein 65-like n=1 Tax=Orussus abietinus TaxID=222816 RepID=UPI000C71614D|nr:coiled-coil domain-containing protein 65-like [Orussus abietinus]
MPPKKGKGSKMARMTDEERARYLQHRAELELEAKRRKQQLIAVFTKIKLKHEEAFARLNLAKINEQWRLILRRIKRKELHEETEYMWRKFDATLEAKDAVIRRLYEELEKADLDHRRLEEAHMTIVDAIIGNHKRRLQALRGGYSQALMDIEANDAEEVDRSRRILQEEMEHIGCIVFIQGETLKSILTETGIRNAIRTQYIEQARDEAISQLEHQVVSEANELWSQLNFVISEYESSTDEKRKQYEFMKKRDDFYRAESTRFHKSEAHLLETIDNLKHRLNVLKSDREGTVTELNDRLQGLEKRICQLRQEIKLSRTTDELQLKRLSVLSGKVLKDLRGILEKGAALQLLVRVCSNLEPASVVIKKYSLHHSVAVVESSAKHATNPFNKMERFWERYNHVKAENIELRRERDRLATENIRLRHTLRTYLIAVARSSNHRPRTCS